MSSHLIYSLKSLQFHKYAIYLFLQLTDHSFKQVGRGHVDLSSLPAFILIWYFVVPIY